MNIAFFVKRTTFHRGFGGLETQNRVLCEGLVKRGHKVTVFSPDWDIKLDSAEENGVNYVFVKCVYRMGPVFGFFGTLQKSNWINRSYDEFNKLHQQVAFDLIVAQSSTGIGLIRNKEFHQLPIVSIAHGTIISEYKTFVMSMSLFRDFTLLVKNTAFVLKNFFRRQRDFVHGSKKIVAVSNFVKKSLVDETFVDENKIVVINNGVDPSPFFESNKALKRGNKLLYVGQVLKSKGMEEIINIFKDSRFSKYTIDIVGDGDFLPSFKKIVSQDENLQNRINFKGKVNYTEVVEKFFKNEEYGVFVFPTKRFEGFPMVIVEALFSGLPIVVYSNGGVGDGVLDAQTGYLIPADAFVKFKEKLLTLLEDNSLRNNFSAAALNFAHSRFTLDIMLDAYENVFREVKK